MITGMPASLARLMAGLTASVSAGEIGDHVDLPRDEVLDDRQLVGERRVGRRRAAHDLDFEAGRLGVVRRPLEVVGRRLEHAGDVRRSPADRDLLRLGRRATGGGVAAVIAVTTAGAQAQATGRHEQQQDPSHGELLLSLAERTAPAVARGARPWPAGDRTRYPHAPGDPRAAPGSPRYRQMRASGAARASRGVVGATVSEEISRVQLRLRKIFRQASWTGTSTALGGEAGDRWPR